MQLTLLQHALNNYRLFPDEPSEINVCLFFTVIKEQKHCRDRGDTALIKVTALRLGCYTLKHMTYVASCDFATALLRLLPDVSEVILSQCLMVVYRPASNNSQPSCLLQATATKANNVQEGHGNSQSAKPGKDISETTIIIHFLHFKAILHD